MESRYKALAKDTILFGISSFASKIMIFLLLPLYTNVLSTYEYGTADIIINLVNLLYPLLTLSIVEAILRFAFAKNIAKNELLTSGLFFVICGIVLLIVIFPFSNVFGKTMHENWGYFVMLFSAYSLQSLFASYCRGSNRSKLFALQGIVQTICLLLFNFLFLILLKWGKNGYLSAMILAYFSAVIFMVLGGKMYRELFPIKINFALVKEMLKYSLPLVPSMIAWWINSSADKYTIIALVGIGASGIYAVAHKIPTILTTISDIFNQAFLISAVNNINQKESNEYFITISKYFLIANCFICCILILLSKFIGSILFSKEYMNGWIYVSILLIAAFFSSLSAYLATFFRTVKKTKILFQSTAWGALVNVICNFLFIHIWGTIGAAYATAISFFVIFLVRYYALNKVIKLYFFTRKNILAIVLIILQGILMSLNLRYKYISSVGIFILLFLLFGKEIISILKMIKRKFIK